MKFNLRIPTLFISLLTISLLPSHFSPNSQAQGQLPKALSTQIEITSTPPDITIVQGKSYISGTGDFNGDRIDDFLIQYWIGSGSSITNINYGIIFGKRNFNSPINIDLSLYQPDLVLRFKQAESTTYGSLGSLGDLNGDGIYDLFFKEFPTATDDKESLYIFYGSSNWHTGEIEFSTLRPDLKILFSQQDYLSGVVDLDGDGSKDLVFTSYDFNHFPGTRVFLGPFTDGETIDVPLKAPDVVIKWVSNWFFFADINGDRIQDILALTTKEQVSGSLPTLYLQVIYGSSAFIKGETTSISIDQADAILNIGTDNPIRFATGDLNKDGNDDIVIGHPDSWGVQNPPWHPGRVDIIFGSRFIRGDITPVTTQILGLPAPLYPIPKGSSLTDGFGDALEVRDINGDGISDLLITSLGFTVIEGGELRQIGRVNVVLGSEKLQNETIVKTGNYEQDITIGSLSENKIIGFSVRSGDFNGDGFSDILAGCRFDFPVSSATPASLLFFGGPLRAPEITEAQYVKSTSKFSIFGKELTGAALVQINGQIIDRDVTFDPEKNRLLLDGTIEELNLHAGKNKIIVIRKGASSNTLKFKLKDNA